MRNRSISINFCGGCNPRIPRGEIATKVRDLLVAMGYTVCYNSLDVDFVIYLSGCLASCAAKHHERNHSSVVVSATCVDAEMVEQEQLVAEIVTKVRNYFE